jgi:ATP-binding cassette subfamily B protein RaxB
MKPLVIWMQRMNKNIKQLGITRIIVAHRQETVNIADRVINLKDLIDNK